MRFGPYWCWMLVFLLAGCGGEDSRNAQGHLWNPENATTPELVWGIGGPSSSVLFGSIRDLDVDRTGRIYVADGENRTIKVISPRGDLLNRIGREGRGPGEFVSLNSVGLGPRDSLYALDSEQSRITAFGSAEAQEAAYSVQLPESETPNTSAVRLMKPDTAGFLVEHKVGYPVPAEVSRRHWVTWIGNDGTALQDSVVSAPAEPLLQYRDLQTQLPFGNESFFRLGADGVTVWTGRNDSLVVKQHRLNGRLVRDVRLPHASVPVTEADVKEAIGAVPPPLQEKLRKAEQDVGFAETHPVFHDFVLDPSGRMWIDVFDDRSEESVWLEVNQSGNVVASYVFPENVSLEVVQNGTAYGIRYGESGLQELVVFELAKGPSA